MTTPSKLTFPVLLLVESDPDGQVGARKCRMFRDADDLAMEVNLNEKGRYPFASDTKPPKWRVATDEELAEHLRARRERLANELALLERNIEELTK